MIAIFVTLGCIILIFGFVVAFGAPYLPSLKKEVRLAFTELYPLGRQDTVVDLGSGDGTVLIEASKLGADCFGVELNPVLATLGRLRLKGRAKILLSNMWRTPLPPNTTLVYIFSVSRDTRKLDRYMQSEANRLKKEISLMTFGASITNRQPVGSRNAHTLYAFKPLQAD
jgi:SAM-dependent methyltransferase